MPNNSVTMFKKENGSSSSTQSENNHRYKQILKQIHKSSKDVDFTKQDTSPCPVCKNLSKTPLYVCEASQVTCANCRNTGDKRQDSGDFATNERHTSATHNLTFRRDLSETVCAQRKDLASGDHDNLNKTSKSKPKSKSEHKIKTAYKNDDPFGSGKYNDTCANHQAPETIVQYKNANYHERKSSNSSSITFEHNFEGENTLQNFKPFLRPVICPVTDCGKIIAIDAIMQHFYFDHSKVPRFTLNCCTLQQVVLKACNVTKKTQCFAVYFLLNQKVPVHRPDLNANINEFNNNQNTLLLIGVRLQSNGKHSSKITSLRESYTQTGVDFQIARKKNNQSADVKQDVSGVIKEKFESNEVLLLWICQLNDIANTYNITVSSEDRKKCHSFTGEAIHIRDKQDVTMVYQRSECLIIHGVAANRLLDGQNRFFVLVNFLK